MLSLVLGPIFLHFLHLILVIRQLHLKNLHLFLHLNLHLQLQRKRAVVATQESRSCNAREP